MEQHSQTQERRGEEQKDLRREETRRSPERESLTTAGLAARAVLAGVPLWELPPDSLEELAGRLGNQEMAALLERRGPAAEETAFRLPPEELETAPFPVPEEPAQLVQPSAGLTAGEGMTAAFDPAGLLE